MNEERTDVGLKSVTTALEILELVAMSPAGMGVSDVAEKVGVTKGGVYRHLQTLVAHGYLWQNPDTSKYRAGVQCHLLGRLAAESLDLLSAAEQPMRALRDTVGLTVTLATYRSGKTVIVERLFGTKPLEIGVRPGSEFEVHASSQGKVFLAFGHRAIWADLEGRALKEVTGHSILDLEKLARQCARAKTLGWAAAPEETLIGINAVSAPVFDAKGLCAAALTLVGSIQYLPREPLSEQVESLIAAAQAISAQLGYRT